MTEVNELINFLNWVDSITYINLSPNRRYWKRDHKGHKEHTVAEPEDLAKAFNNRFK